MQLTSDRHSFLAHIAQSSPLDVCKCHCSVARLESGHSTSIKCGACYMTPRPYVWCSGPVLLRGDGHQLPADAGHGQTTSASGVRQRSPCPCGGAPVRFPPKGAASLPALYCCCSRYVSFTAHDTSGRSHTCLTQHSIEGSLRAAEVPALKQYPRRSNLRGVLDSGLPGVGASPALRTQSVRLCVHHPHQRTGLRLVRSCSACCRGASRWRPLSRCACGRAARASPRPRRPAHWAAPPWAAPACQVTLRRNSHPTADFMLMW